MSFSETVFLFFLALVIFGPKKLPEIARQVGKMLNEFRRASNEFKAQIEQEIAHIELEERKKTTLPPAAPPEGTTSRTLNAASSVPSSTSDPVVGETDNGAIPSTLAVSQEEPVPINGHRADETPDTEAVAASSGNSQETHA
ncbi:MAG TPA: twin-arginine translocase TatA/TatE family subunit [Candidatus Sulfotelmatobacter sp.]|nr:twin-arginine translocase TatA/TatE family subunit [Candidatus Sulfotelmatobacter sp.]